MSDASLPGPELERRLTAWLQTQLPSARELAIEGLASVEFGHSAEMLTFSAAWEEDGHAHRQDLVLRLRPPLPWLLEPYDMRRQFAVMRALENTPVRAPRVRWLEESGDVLGRPFLVMERLEGQVYEREVVEELSAAPERVSAMADSAIDQVAHLHLVDLKATGLDALGDGSTFLQEQLDHWAGELARWQRGPLPAQELLLEHLRRTCPDPTPQVTLVHGDPKSGNFAFVDDEVSAVFDWELATVGDPMADIGWLDVTWRLSYPFITFEPSRFEDLLARYEERTGIAIHHREWHRGMQLFKMSVIQLAGSMLFDRGHTDDPRFVEMGYAIRFILPPAFIDLGLDVPEDWGPVLPSKERRAILKPAAAS